jgi:hypothetical protein
VIRLCYTTDDGETWVDCQNGIRVLIEGVCLPGEEEDGDLVFNFKNERVITDTWNVEGRNLGTASQTYEETVNNLDMD